MTGDVLLCLDREEAVNGEGELEFTLVCLLPAEHGESHMHQRITAFKPRTLRGDNS